MYCDGDQVLRYQPCIKLVVEKSANRLIDPNVNVETWEGERGL